MIKKHGRRKAYTANSIQYTQTHTEERRKINRWHEENIRLNETNNEEKKTELKEKKNSFKYNKATK